MGKPDELFEIPLILLNVVLFPGMVLPLHIFESRYRAMVAHCLADNAPFGVVLTGEPTSEGGETPARVGTLARIVSYKQLPDGRYNLLTHGTKRFEIVDLRQDKPYLIGRVRPFNDIELSGPGMGNAVIQAHRILRQYLSSLTTLVGIERQEVSIPTDPVDLSFLMGMCLTCEDCDKQALLEMQSVPQRLRAGTYMVRCELDAIACETESHRPSSGD